MKRFRWGLLKTLEYVSSKKSDIQLSHGVLRLLKNYELELNKECTAVKAGDKKEGDVIPPLSLKWSEFFHDGEYIEDEKLLTNTFLNTNVHQHQDVRRNDIKGANRATDNACALQLFLKREGIKIVDDFGAKHRVYTSKKHVIRSNLAEAKKRFLKLKVNWRDEVTKKRVVLTDGKMKISMDPLTEVIPENFMAKYSGQHIFSMSAAYKQT